jgi:transglutaminase-like putative cysteine protease
VEARSISRFVVAVILAIGFGLSLLPRTAQAVANFNYDTKVRYQIEADGRAAVTQDFTVTNNTARLYLSELKLTTATADISDLKAIYSDGSAMPAAVARRNQKQGDLNFDTAEITVSFPRQIVGSGRTWTFKVTYSEAGLASGKGGSHMVFLPAVEPGDADDNYQATVDVPADFGTPHFAGARSASGGVAGSRQFYIFNKADLTGHALALAFGDTTIYQANFNFPLVNTSPLPRTLTATLPPDLNNQKVYINSLKPAPAGLRLDEDGNVLADYHLRPFQRLTVETDITVAVNYLEYDLGLSGKRADIPADLVKRYTGSTTFWQTDKVAAAARGAVEADAPVINQVKALYQLVIKKLNYNQNKIQFNIRQGAAAALARPDNAVCLEYADLLVALLRSQGIPARMPVGYSYSGILKASDSVADSLHAWVEAYVPGIGWITLDPTWGEKFDQFGRSDLDHLAFAVWGRDDQHPAAVMAGLSDLGYQYEKTTLEFKSAYQPTLTAASLKARRFALLPFMALDRFIVQAPGGEATDNNQVTADGSVWELGSLAPRQKVTFFRLKLGSSWNRPGEAQFLRRDATSGAVLATAGLSTDYGVMIGLAGAVLIAAAIGLVLRLRRPARRGQRRLGIELEVLADRPDAR